MLFRSRRPREEAPRRAEAAPRAETTPRAPRPEPARAAPRDGRRDRQPVDDGPDEGWNGPIPSFLDFKLGA